jgi:hypothetical protein
MKEIPLHRKGDFGKVCQNPHEKLKNSLKMAKKVPFWLGLFVIFPKLPKVLGHLNLKSESHRAVLKNVNG